jgi:hypothetical protein
LGSPENIAKGRSPDGDASALMETKDSPCMSELLAKTRCFAFASARQGVLTVCLLAALMVPTASRAGVLSEEDLRMTETLRPLFANLMNDLVQTVRRSDVVGGDVSCINSTIQELLQISGELASYEYLIAMDKDMTGFGDKNPMRDIVKFAADKSNAILTSERKRLVQLSDQCARFPTASSKTQQVLQVIDTTTGILTAIRDRL